MSQNNNENKYNCPCGAAFDTLKDLDKHNHNAHWSYTKPHYFSFIIRDYLKEKSDWTFDSSINNKSDDLLNLS